MSIAPNMSRFLKIIGDPTISDVNGGRIFKREHEHTADWEWNEVPSCSSVPETPTRGRSTCLESSLLEELSYWASIRCIRN